MKNTASQIKTLQILVGVLLVLLSATAAATLYLLKQNGHFTEITAGRINVAEEDGTLRMVISNHQKQHPGMFNNKLVAARERPAGIIFFNDAGDECGGLIYDGEKNNASMTYSVDQYKNDQIMQWQYQQSSDQGQLLRSYGLKWWDRPDSYTMPQLIRYTDSLKNLPDPSVYDKAIQQLQTTGALGRERMFAGKNKSGEVGLFLRDANGIPRLNIYINAQNQPVIETLDINGRPIKSK